MECRSSQWLTTFQEDSRRFTSSRLAPMRLTSCCSRLPVLLRSISRLPQMFCSLAMEPICEHGAVLATPTLGELRGPLRPYRYRPQAQGFHRMQVDGSTAAPIG